MACATAALLCALLAVLLCRNLLHFGFEAPAAQRIGLWALIALADVLGAQSTRVCQLLVTSTIALCVASARFYFPAGSVSANPSHAMQHESWQDALGTLSQTNHPDSAVGVVDSCAVSESRNQLDASLACSTSPASHLPQCGIVTTSLCPVVALGDWWQQAGHKLLMHLVVFAGERLVQPAHRASHSMLTTCHGSIPQCCAGLLGLLIYNPAVKASLHSNNKG